MHYLTAVTQKLANRVTRKATKLAKRALTPFLSADTVTKTSFDLMCRESGIKGASEFIHRSATRPLIIRHLNRAFIAETFSSSFPDERRTLIERAENIHRNIYDELGSGPTDLSNDTGGMRWNEDFKSGVRWETGHFLHATIVKRNSGADIKTIWELSRFHQGVTLAQAEILTDDDRHRIKFMGLVDDWQRQNPCPYGPNWVCPMDVAIRAVNWIVAAELFAVKHALPEPFLATLYASLFQHGAHIRANLETVGDGLNTNHYLANLIGLLALGKIFDAFADGQEWMIFAMAELEKEIVAQTTDEGFCHESSAPYHLLVSEFYLFALTLCRHNKINIPLAFVRRLNKMMELTLSLAGSSGQCPLIGDNDSGRLLKLADRRDGDARWILFWAKTEGVGPHSSITSPSATPESLWLYGGREMHIPKGRTLNPSKTTVRSKYWKNSGLIVMAEGALHMCANAMHVGVNGVGGHKHNDELALTLRWGDSDILIDPGMKAYTSDERERNRLRSISAHSTIAIKGEETNRFLPGYAFALRPGGKVHVDAWLSSREFDVLQMSHTCYGRLAGSIRTSRSILFDKIKMLWLIRDTVDTADISNRNLSRIAVTNSLILPDATVSTEKGVFDIPIVSEAQKLVAIRVFTPLNSVTSEAFEIAPAYGVGRLAKRVTLLRESAAPVEFIWGIFANCGPERKEYDHNYLRTRIQQLGWPMPPSIEQEMLAEVKLIGQ